MLDALACRHPFLLTRGGIVSYNLMGVIVGLGQRNQGFMRNWIKSRVVSLKFFQRR